MTWHPIPGNIMTPWEKDVSPDNVWQEYPRPQMTRREWMNLNGLWKYWITKKDQTIERVSQGEILVPFPIESALSGVKRPFDPSEMLWYQRTFIIPGPWRGKRVLLHFGAVDWETKVFVNHQVVGEHVGGYLPFTLDITSALAEDENELLVSVWDPSDLGLQQNGKQTLKPHETWYSAVSGIWQTVWLEVVEQISIGSIQLTPDLDKETLTIWVKLHDGRDREPVSVEVEAYDQGKSVATCSGKPGETIILSLPKPIKPWCPEDPFLYDLSVRLIHQGQLVDEVGSYFAMRKFTLIDAPDGYKRFALNNKPLFLYGALDQGYFPDGLYTPPSEEAMLFDIKLAQRLGFNFLRKHVKVEPLRWYYACDRLGMIVWQDMPNGGRRDDDFLDIPDALGFYHPADTHHLERYGRGEEANRAQFTTELQGMVDLLYNSPCIAAWVIFNERWGQFHANDHCDWLKKRDPTRLVDHASGYIDQNCGDFLSKHMYILKLSRPKSDRRAFCQSEFGGYVLRIPGHVWDEKRTWGYRTLKTHGKLTQAYVDLLKKQVQPLIKYGLMAAIYTQLTDVEIEINGFVTYDREVEKMDFSRVRQAHEELIG